MSTQEHFKNLERMYLSAPTNKYFVPRIKISQGTAEIILPVQTDFFHAANAVHGAVYFKALDDASFFAVNSLVEDVFVLTVSFMVYFTRPISKGEIKAIGRVVHASNRLFITEAEATDSEGRQIAKGSGTFMRSNISLGPELGYV